MMKRVRKIKQIDINNDVPENIKKISKNKLTESILFKKKKILVEGDKLKTSYLIFALEYIKSSYSLSYEDIMILCYVQEIGLSNFTINVLGKSFSLVKLLSFKYVEENYKIDNKKMYKVSDSGFKIINEFNNILENPDPFISENRETEMGVDNTVADALADYFS